MTSAEAEEFVGRFAEARRGGGGHELWNARGRLHYPLADRVIVGHEIAALNALSREQAPNLTWELLGWTHRDDVIVVEWQCTNRYAEKTVSFSGVDKLTIEDGLIVEEVVYTDTMPLQAMRTGLHFDALIHLTPRA